MITQEGLGGFAVFSQVCLLGSTFFFSYCGLLNSFSVLYWELQLFAPFRTCLKGCCLIRMEWHDTNPQISAFLVPPAIAIRYFLEIPLCGAGWSCSSCREDTPGAALKILPHERQRLQIHLRAAAGCSCWMFLLDIPAGYSCWVFMLAPLWTNSSSRYYQGECWNNIA